MVSFMLCELYINKSKQKDSPHPRPNVTANIPALFVIAGLWAVQMSIDRRLSGEAVK